MKKAIILCKPPQLNRPKTSVVFFIYLSHSQLHQLSWRFRQMLQKNRWNDRLNIVCRCPNNMTLSLILFFSASIRFHHRWSRYCLPVHLTLDGSSCIILFGLKCAWLSSKIQSSVVMTRLRNALIQWWLSLGIFRKKERNRNSIALMTPPSNFWMGSSQNNKSLLFCHNNIAY